MNEEIDGIKISNPNRIVYPKQKITKLDVALYYQSVSKYMMPYLEKRLLSVIRAHQGIKGELFFKKHPKTENKLIKKFAIEKDKEEYFYLPNEKAIIYQAQMGTIEFHIWASKVSSINKPDIMTFDLDPDKKVSIEMLREGVKNLKKVIDKLKLKSFLKTSGGKGYHVLVPFNASYSWEEFEDFAKNIALYLEGQYPDLYTSNIRKASRKGKIFIDYMRNGRGATCACPYSLRARDGAKISMPISWNDLERVAPNEVDIFNYKSYLKKNPWRNFFKSLK